MKKVRILSGEKEYLTTLATVQKSKYLNEKLDQVKRGENEDDIPTISVERNPYLFREILKYLRGETNGHIPRDIRPELKYYLTCTPHQDDIRYITINCGGKQFTTTSELLTSNSAYFRGILASHYADSSDIFLDISPQTFHKFLRYLQDPNYKMPFKYAYILDYFGIESGPARRLDKGTVFEIEETGIQLNPHEETHTNEELYFDVSTAMVSLGTTRTLKNKNESKNIPDYTHSLFNILPCNPYSVAYINLRKETPTHTCVRFSFSRIVDIYTKLFLFIPPCQTGNPEGFPFSVINKIFLTPRPNGIAVFEISGRALYDQFCLSAPPNKVQYNSLIQKSNCGAFIELDEENFSPIPTSSLPFDEIDLEVQIEPSFSGKIDTFRMYCHADAMLLDTDERAKFGRTPSTMAFNSWNTQTIEVSTPSSSISHIPAYDGIFRKIIFSAQNREGKRVPIKQFKVFLGPAENNLLVNEFEEKIVHREVSNGLYPKIGLYEWSINKCGSWRLGHLERGVHTTFRFEFYEPLEGSVTIHIFYTHLFNIAGGSMALNDNFTPLQYQENYQIPVQPPLFVPPFQPNDENNENNEENVE